MCEQLFLGTKDRMLHVKLYPLLLNYTKKQKCVKFKNDFDVFLLKVIRLRVQ